MSSTHAVECPLGATCSIKDNCQTDSLEYVVLDIDEKETLQLRSGCDASVHSVCQYHWHKYFEIYICKLRWHTGTMTQDILRCARKSFHFHK